MSLEIEKHELAAKIDHTLLKPFTSISQIEKLCQEAIDYEFASVCVLPWHISAANGFLKDRKPEVCSVVGFPLGSTFKASKLKECELALKNGATEIDMVMNLSAFASGYPDIVGDEIYELAEMCHSSQAILKVIIETSLLDQKQKADACKIVSGAGADFIKTSTGFSGGGATLEDIKLMRENCPVHVKVKASGGIKTAEFAIELIAAGADRIGASAGVEIVNSLD